MANTTSLAFPKMFNVSQNTVAVLEDNKSIVNRDRLLILTNPTELYNSPEQGVGLYKFIGRYNDKNVEAEIIDRIKEQLARYEPYVESEKTEYAEGLLFTGSQNDEIKAKPNTMQFTLSLKTTYNETVNLTT